jgi:hypothetical protein
VLHATPECETPVKEWNNKLGLQFVSSLIVSDLGWARVIGVMAPQEDLVGGATKKMRLEASSIMTTNII